MCFPDTLYNSEQQQNVSSHDDWNQYQKTRILQEPGFYK